MDIPFDQILAVVRDTLDPVEGFRRLREVAKAKVPSPIWDSLPTPDVAADIAAARSWLDDSIVAFAPTGVYLGLDTLNQDGGAGKNVEVGMTRAADPAALEMDWAWHCERYGSDHLIAGLHTVHAAYESLELNYSDGLLADYVFFLGYSGIVLASALELLPASWESLYVWGFHDGDLAFLARGMVKGVTRLAALPTR